MHEVSIIEGLIDLVEAEKVKHHFTRVLEVQINCGIYNCVSQENLEFCLKWSIIFVVQFSLQRNILNQLTAEQALLRV